MATDAAEMARKILAVIELHEFGVQMMRRRLVQEHGDLEGHKRLRAWLAADRWQGPGCPSNRTLTEP